MNGKLEIVIRKGENGNEFTTRETTTRKEKIDPGQETSQAKLIAPLIEQYSMKLMNEGINVYSNLTGNTIQTNKINSVINIASDIILATSGIPGAIAVGLKYVTQVVNEQIEVQKAYDKSAFIQRGMGKIVNSYGRYN